MAPTFVSLYSGAGGLDLGFAMAGFTPLFANDKDSDAVETYDNLFKRLADEFGHLDDSHRAIAGEVQSAEVLSALAGLAPDVVIGGPPCQGFSIAGRMDPADPRSLHVRNFLKIVESRKPKAFVMENVKALAVNRRWETLLGELRDEAHGLKYSTELYVLNASHFGVPQARERMFLIGLSEDYEHEAPRSTTSDHPPTVRSALTVLPPWGEAGNDTICTAKVTPAITPVMRRSPYAGMLFNGQGRPLNLDSPAPTLPATMGGNRTPIVDQEQLDAGGDCWILGYHKHLRDGGAPYESIPRRMRRLTVEEAAAVQTFPPEMDWSGRQSSKYRQIGNAVPPLLALAVGRAVRSSLRLPGFQTPPSVLGLTTSAPEQH